MQTHGNIWDSDSVLDGVRHLLNDMHDDLPGKVARLRLLGDLYATKVGVHPSMVPGGELVLDVWREARWSFVHGNYVATILLCQGFVEHLLATATFAAGEDLSDRVSFGDVLKRAGVLGYVSDQDMADIRRLIDLRNPLSHFRPPLDPSSYNIRSMNEDELPGGLMQRDGTFAIGLAVRMLGKLSLGGGVG